jgi:hypothetical protein
MACQVDIPWGVKEQQDLANKLYLLVSYLRSCGFCTTQEVDVAMNCVCIQNTWPLTAAINTLAAWVCLTCESMTEEQKSAVIYDGSNSKARALADWWDQHQKDDKIRLEHERANAEREIVKRQAMAKLTTEEKASLGLPSKP